MYIVFFSCKVQSSPLITDICSTAFGCGKVMRSSQLIINTSWLLRHTSSYEINRLSRNQSKFTARLKFEVLSVGYAIYKLYQNHMFLSLIEDFHCGFYIMKLKTCNVMCFIVSYRTERVYISVYEYNAS